MKCTSVQRAILAFSCSLALLGSSSAATVRPATPPAAGTPEILWDGYGIPHIYGADIPTVLRGFGYAQMTNHAETILGNIAQARGRAAEYFGAGADNAYVSSDIQVRTLGIPQRAAKWLVDGGGEQRTYLQAMADGMNKYALLHSATISPVFQQILPVTPEDLLADFQNTINFTFEARQSNVQALLAAWQAGGIAAANQVAASLGQAMHNGSNGWAVGPYRSKTGNPILVGNPHLPWGNNTPLPNLGLFQWMEAQLVVGNPAKPDINVSGVTFVGSAFIGVGFNDNLGWTHTNNLIKNADLYELTLTGPGSYLFEGQSLPLDITQDSVKIRQADGSYVTQYFPVASSVHGPIIASNPQTGKALALKLAGLDTPAATTQYWGMMKARNLTEFSQANAALQMPYFNVVYADKFGHVMYLFGGQQPVRSGGTFYDWIGILPGDKQSALWTMTLTWDQLPKTIDPPGGFVQNCNDGPWTSTFPQTVRHADYPAWISPDFMELRAQSCARFLLSKPKFSVDDLVTGKMSTYMSLVNRVLPDLMIAAVFSGDSTARAAAATLLRWNGTADEQSRGAVLFERWYDLYAANPAVPKDTTMSLFSVHPAFRIGWSAANPLNTPYGLRETKIAVQTLILAAQQVKAQYGALDVPFGDVHRTVLATHDASFQQVIPISNAPLSGPDDVFGAPRTINRFPAPDGKSFWSYGGDGYVQVIEFAKDGPRAQALLNYGNASRPGSPHITDQLSLFNAKKLRPSWRTRAEVEKNTVLREAY